MGSTRKWQSTANGMWFEAKVYLMVGLRPYNCWKNLATVPLQAIRFLEAEVYPVLQAMGAANMA